VSGCSSGTSRYFYVLWKMRHWMGMFPVSTVGSLWGFCGPPWPTWKWYYEVGICNAEALHFVELYSHDQLKIGVACATGKRKNLNNCVFLFSGSLWVSWNKCLQCRDWVRLHSICNW
jgi:hypothetical protein